MRGYRQKYLSQCTTKSTIRLAPPAKIEQPAHLCSLISVFDCMCLLQPLSYPKRDKREPLPYWIDVQADPSLCWSLGSYCRFCRALALYSYYIRGLDKEEYIFEATFSDIVIHVIYN